MKRWLITYGLLEDNGVTYPCSYCLWAPEPPSADNVLKGLAYFHPGAVVTDVGFEDVTPSATCECLECRDRRARMQAAPSPTPGAHSPAKH